MLQKLVNNDIIVRLKWNETEYHGKLVSMDSYLNLQLSGAKEHIDGKSSDLGQVLIRYFSSRGVNPGVIANSRRCNNVLWIKAANQGGDTKMEG